MTKDEAEQEAVNKAKNIVLGFCPLINGKCNTECVCYEGIRVSSYHINSTGGTAYNVVSGYCKNMMFFPD